MSKSIITRRRLLSTVAIGAAAVGMTACAGQSAPDVLKQAVADVSLIGSGLNSILPDLSSLVPANTMAQVRSWLSVITGAATQLSGMPSVSAGVPVVQQVEQAVNAIAGIAAPLLSATPYGAVVTAAVALLPAIEAAVGMIHLGRAAMSPEEARLILRAAR